MTEQRAAFEAWHTGKYGRAFTEWTEAKGRYAWDLTEELWAAWQACASRRSALPAGGWKLVPIEPNDDMQLAGAQAVRFDTTPLNKLWTANAAYRAMLAAAPQQQENPK